MKTYLLASQYLEDYETRFKPKGGRDFVVDAPDLWTALALVHKFLFREQQNVVTLKGVPVVPVCEFPIIPFIGAGVDAEWEFLNASHAIAQIPEYRRDENVRLVYGDENTMPPVL
jgi:hypothetical protein